MNTTHQRLRLVLGIALLAGRGWAADKYVSLSGGHNAPFESWADAATNIQAAVGAAALGETVWVTNGTYTLTNSIVITNGITVRSVNGAGATVVDGNNAARCFLVDHSNAVVEGFTIRKGAVAAGNNQPAGSGVYINRGTVRNCVIAENRLSGQAGDGIGVFMTNDSRLVNCVVANNSYTGTAGTVRGAGVFCWGGEIWNSIIRGNTNAAINSDGGGLYLTGGGVARNCLIVGNWAKNGGGVYGGTQKGRIENCTVVSNGVLLRGGGTYATAVTNSIVFFNFTKPDNFPFEREYALGSMGYSCSWPLAPGPGNTNAAPWFRDMGQGDYRLLPGSPGLDGGTNFAWMASTNDLDGNPRIVPGWGRSDMGCYEYLASNLLCSLDATPRRGVAPLDVTFTAYVGGTNLDGLWYGWDIGNDGLWDVEGAGLSEVHTNLEAGVYTIRLHVSNAVGEIAARVETNMVIASLSTAYVWAGGAAISPYTNWVNAATNIQAAVDAVGDGVTVLVTNGVYGLFRHIVIDKGITVKGLNGADVTVVDGNNAVRCFLVDHSNAVVEGFTIRKGAVEAGYNLPAGSGVYINRGTVRNCVIAENRLSGQAGDGIGVYMTNDSRLVNCVVANNSYTGTAGTVRGAGVSCWGGEIWNSVIRGNTNAANNSDGGGLYLTGGRVARNCLIVDNLAKRGGGVFGGLIQNCTVVSNRGHTATAEGCGTYNSSSTNSIVFSNVDASGNITNFSGGTYAYSCTWPLRAGIGNIDSDPLFIAPALNNYRLQKDSPCVDAGTNMAWMIDGVDLDRKPRLNRRVDMGCYEFRATGTVLLIR